MHAVIHLALKKYAETRYGAQAWLRFLELAGVTTALPYVRVGQYPDEELHAIVAAIARDQGIPSDAVLEEFGAATAGDLIAMYPRLIRREWRSLDLICHTEETIHAIVRQQTPGARPAIVTCERLSSTEVRLTYRSARRLCAFARGIIRGVAEYYGEAITVVQPQCMLRGDPLCELLLRLEAGAEAPHRS
jgi:predicted hydrocarbon binding protein